MKLVSFCAKGENNICSRHFEQEIPSWFEGKILSELYVNV